jgi:hypothetical protein
MADEKRNKPLSLIDMLDRTGEMWALIRHGERDYSCQIGRMATPMVRAHGATARRAMSDCLLAWTERTRQARAA